MVLRSITVVVVGVVANVKSSVKAMLTLVHFVKSMPRPGMPDLFTLVAALPYLILNWIYDDELIFTYMRNL
jgi:hypothetical protein